MSQLVRNFIAQPAEEPEPPPRDKATKAQEKRRMRGVLIRISEKGFAFIRPPGGGVEYFVHIDQLLDRSLWVEGREVTFIPGQPKPDSRKAPPAYSVKAVKESTDA